MSNRGITKGTLLGKCQWCTQPIREGDGTFASYWAKIVQTKWYCAECLVALKPIIDDLSLEKEYSEDKKQAEDDGNLDFLKQKWIVEVGTGKIHLNPKYEEKEEKNGLWDRYKNGVEKVLNSI